MLAGHENCPPCDCKHGTEHCKHEHQPWGLTDTERSVLDFASRVYRYPGAREADIRSEFGWSAVRHAQVELALLERAEAWEYAPQTVKRLTRLRDARAAVRAG